MTTITVKIDGMMCGQCEAHVNDAFRRKLSPKKVSSSSRKKETVLVVENDVPDEEIIAALEGTGYRVEGIARGEERKKGFFFHRK